MDCAQLDGMGFFTCVSSNPRRSRVIEAVYRVIQPNLKLDIEISIAEREARGTGGRRGR